MQHSEVFTATIELNKGPLQLQAAKAKHSTIHNSETQAHPSFFLLLKSYAHENYFIVCFSKLMIVI